MWDAIISAGASIISGLVGGKKQTTTSNRINYKQMVRDAEAAGFNPLTALRNGGAAGYSSATTTTAAPLSATIADSVAGGVHSFLANFDPMKDQMREAEFKLVEAQLANLNADTANKVRFGEVPTYTAGQNAKAMGSGVSQGQTFNSVADVLPASAGSPQTPKVENPSVTNPWGQIGFGVDPNQPDGASWEDRYGEYLGGVLGGVIPVGADIWHNTKPWVKKGYGKAYDWLYPPSPPLAPLKITLRKGG